MGVFARLCHFVREPRGVALSVPERLVIAQRAGDPAGGVISVPWLQARPYSLLQIGGDLVGNAAVDADWEMRPNAGTLAKIRSLAILSQGNSRLRPIVLVLGNWEATQLGDWDEKINSPEARGSSRRSFLGQL
jgi:hypothetical protein